jgi:hypothetical protein
MGDLWCADLRCLVLQSEPDCLELLGECVKAFQSIPQRYCLYCEANAALGPEAHRADCPLRRASELIKTK